MRNALISALVSAIVAASAGTAATVSLMDRTQNERITRLERHDAHQKKRIAALEWYRDWTEVRYGKTGEQIQAIYSRSFGCLGRSTPEVVVRTDGTLGIPAPDDPTPWDKRWHLVGYATWCG